jgi:hypothetical protein
MTRGMELLFRRALRKNKEPVALVDAKEFHGTILDRACQNYSIELH